MEQVKQNEEEIKAKEEQKEETKEEKEIKEEKLEQEAEEKEVPLEELPKEELIEKINQLSEEVKKYFDLYLRSQAEIDNLKKRFRREREEFVKFANEALIKELLTVLDNLERAISHSQKEQSEESLKALREGVELTLKGMKDILKKAGLEEFESLGKKFDPKFHHAVGEKEDSSVEPGTVVEELQKGYLLHGKLIRPAMVVVSKKKQE